MFPGAEEEERQEGSVAIKGAKGILVKIEICGFLIPVVR